MSDPLEIFAQIAQAFEADQETANGEIQENKFEVKLNEFEPEGGITAKFQLLFDGPELTKEQETGSSIFPDKTADDLLSFTAIRVKGNADEALAELKTIIESLGVTEEMWAAFAQVEFKAEENEILIGACPANEELLGVLAPFMINPTFIKGDGNEDISIEASVNFATTFSEALDDEPFYSHFLKGAGVSFKGRVFNKSRDILIKIMNSQWDTIKPLVSQFPILAPILLFKKLDGSLELECDDTLREEIKELLLENMPPAAMSLKDAMSLVKQQGMVPMEMAEPILEWFKNHFAGEIRLYAQRSVGIKVTMKLPGLDEVVTEFLNA